MRAPPEMHKLLPGTRFEAAVRQVQEDITAAMAWMVEAVDIVASATQSERTESQESGMLVPPEFAPVLQDAWRHCQAIDPMVPYRMCPDCTDTQPCARARRLMGEQA